ncbi:MAG: DNA repair protein RadA, partial [Bacillota bacterium]
MSKQKYKYVCQQCSYEASRWLGKCPECGAWNSLVEETIEKKTVAGIQKNGGVRPEPLAQIKPLGVERLDLG